MAELQLPFSTGWMTQKPTEQTFDFDPDAAAGYGRMVFISHWHGTIVATLSMALVKRFCSSALF